MWEVIIISNAILKISQLVDEFIKKIPAAILNGLSGVSLIHSFHSGDLYSASSRDHYSEALCVVAFHWWYNANLNKAVIRKPAYAPVAQS